MDAQLREVITALDRHAVPYWLESGTLLGLVRDGRLLPGDPDIDIGCWEGDTAAFDAAVHDFRRLGYRVVVRRYAGRIYKYKIAPSLRAQRRGRRLVDVAVYWRHGDRAWSPAFAFTLSSHRRWSLRWLVDQGARSVVKVIWLRVAAPRTWSLRLPRMRLTMGTWSIPARFFETTEELEIGGQQVRVPTDHRGYLTFRYGEWETPVADWEWFTDDGGVVHEIPEAAMMDTTKGREDTRPPADAAQHPIDDGEKP